MKRILLFFFTLLLSPWIWAQKPTVTIQLTGGNSITHAVNEPFVDPGFTATDSALNDYSNYVIVTGSIDTTILGVYQLMYSIPDSVANTPLVTRTVTVVDTVPPIIQLLGQTIMIATDSIFEEPGFKLLDNYYPDSLLRKLLTITHSANITTTGYSYILLDKGPGWISYHLIDPAGNVADSALRFFSKIVLPGMPELATASFTIYPNPAFDIIMIKSEHKIDRCFIMDALGNISPLSIQNNASGLQVDVSEFDNGMYTFIIESGEQRSFSKLVLTHPR